MQLRLGRSRLKEQETSLRGRFKNKVLTFIILTIYTVMSYPPATLPLIYIRSQQCNIDSYKRQSSLDLGQLVGGFKNRQTADMITFGGYLLINTEKNILKLLGANKINKHHQDLVICTCGLIKKTINNLIFIGIKNSYNQYWHGHISELNESQKQNTG